MKKTKSETNSTRRRNPGLPESVWQTIVFWSVILGWALVSAGASDWGEEYHRLYTKIEESFSEPKGQPAQLEPYLRWMETKARDREDVKSLLELAQTLWEQNPQNDVLGLWVKKFNDLLAWAQASGENTVNGAVLRFMRIQDRNSHLLNWINVIGRLRDYGWPILLKAKETSFVTSEIRKAATCMLNFSIRDVEGNPYGFGVYEGRKGEFNIPAQRDFDAD